MTGPYSQLASRLSQEHPQARALCAQEIPTQADQAPGEEIFTPDASAERMALRSPWRRRGAVLLLAFLVIVCSRWPLRTTYLTNFDAANFTFALDDFNPAYHRPQPPGYPLFVALTRAVHWAVPDPERVLPIAGILGSIVAVVLLFKLGNVMFGRPVGACAAALLLVHPALWFASVINPVRVYLAAGSVAVALLCWLALRLPQQRRWFWYSGAALGLAAGFRPELVLFLLPVTLLAVLAARRKIVVVFALIAFTLATVVWLVPMVAVFGGPLTMLQFFADYLRERSGDSVVLGAGLDVAAPHWLVALRWTFLPALAWLWAIPLVRLNGRSEAGPRRWIFVALWLLPGFLFHALIHIHHPDQALGAAPALCLIGGWVLSQPVRGEWRARTRKGVRAALLSAAIAASVFLFWHRLDWAPRSTGYYGLARWTEDVSKATIESIQGSVRSGSTFLITSNGAVPWRVLQYYFPEQVLVVLPTDLREAPPANGEVWFIRHGIMEKHVQAGEPIPLPGGERGVWDTPGDQAVQDLVATTPGVERDGAVWSFDARPGMEFGVGNYEFVIQKP